MSPDGATVIRLSSAKQAKMSDKKWGPAVMELGFCIIPSLLLRAQARLQLTPVQLAVVIQLCDYWWDSERKPFPSKAHLAARLKIGERQVQRHLTALEEAGILRRVERGPGQTNEYDLSPLVARLKEVAPEVKKAKEESQARHQALMRPGLKSRVEPVATKRQALTKKRSARAQR